MKRLFCLILAVLMLSACGAPSDNSSADLKDQETESGGPISDESAPTPEPVTDVELLRAIEAGIVPAELQGDYSSAVSFDQCARLVSGMLGVYRPELLPGWEELAQKALDTTSPMRRDDGMLMVYEAACLMGMGGEIHRYWLDVNGLCGDIWGELSPSKDIFENWAEPSPFEDNPGNVPGWTYDVSAYFYSLGSCSKISGKALFDCDAANATMRLSDPLTREEAIRAVLRLTEALPEVYGKAVNEVPETDWSDPALASAARARDAILNSHIDVVSSGTWEQGRSYTGNAWYISSLTGDDANSGTSPDDALASVQGLKNLFFSGKLRAGDAVLFERGGVYPLNDYEIQGLDNVTYAAYGQGPKPIISGSVEGMADPGRWELYAETPDGGKIWRFDTELHNVVGIFFDGDTSWGTMCLPGWNGETYMDASDGSAWTVETGMTEDLSFFSEMPLHGLDVTAGFIRQQMYGPLYLRCDAGNPGEVFAAIDVIQDINAIGFGYAPGNTGTGGAVVDLAFKYCTIPLVSGLNGDSDAIGTLVENCEISFCGGSIQSYSDTDGLPYLSGGAVLASGNGHTVRNCYIHDVDNKVFVVVANSPEWLPSDHLTFEGNIIERCGAALRICNYMEQALPDSVYKELRFENNTVIHTGYGWYAHKLFRTNALSQLSSFETEQYVNRNEGITISGNTFYCPRGAVYCGTGMWGDAFPIFSGNTVVQVPGAGLVDAGPAGTQTLYMTGDTESCQEALRDILGDSSLQLIKKENA